MTPSLPSPSLPVFYHKNRQYNTVALTDAVGAIVEQYSTDAIGRVKAFDAAATTKSEPTATTVLFTGRVWDVETGLYYFRARYFEPELGVFVSRDPLGFVDGYALYQGWFHTFFSYDPSGCLADTPVTVGVGADNDSIQTLLDKIYQRMKKETSCSVPCLGDLRINSHGDGEGNIYMGTRGDHSADQPIGPVMAARLARVPSNPRIIESSTAASAIAAIEAYIRNMGPSSTPQLVRLYQEYIGDIRRMIAPNAGVDGNDNPQAEILNAGNAAQLFSNLKFCKPCKIYLLACASGNANGRKLIDEIHKLTGCSVFAPTTNVQGTSGTVPGAHSPDDAVDDPSVDPTTVPLSTDPSTGDPGIWVQHY